MMILPVKIPNYLASIPYLVDDEDYERVSRFTWWPKRKGYIGTSFNKNKIITRLIFHRFIMNCPKGMQVDHIDGNKLDNRKSNLRICSNAQNSFNKPKGKRNTSGFKGVFKNHKRWIARISVGGKKINGGTFDTKEEASKDYERLSKKYHGEFGRIE